MINRLLISGRGFLKMSDSFRKLQLSHFVHLFKDRAILSWYANGSAYAICWLIIKDIAWKIDYNVRGQGLDS